VLLFLSGVKLICEIALMALLGQGILFVLAGPKRDTNFFYQMLKVLTKPFTWAVRKTTPRQVADQHVPVVAFCLLVVIWAVATFEKIRYCVGVGVEACK
jgi:hypothetical protein